MKEGVVSNLNITEVEINQLRQDQWICHQRVNDKTNWKN